MKWPANVWMQGNPIVPHAYGFVYHQIMGDKPPPNVPILMNTFYPPTQPSMKRCIAFGKALQKAIQAWDSDKTRGPDCLRRAFAFRLRRTLDQTFLSHFGRMISTRWNASTTAPTNRELRK